MQLEKQDLFEIADPLQQHVAYDLGYMVVWRIGLTRLRELCAEARSEGLKRIPPDVLCREARLDPRAPVSWIAALVETIRIPRVLPESANISPKAQGRE
jgi:hypothetical protein